MGIHNISTFRCKNNTLFVKMYWLLGGDNLNLGSYYPGDNLNRGVGGGGEEGNLSISHR